MANTKESFDVVSLPREDFNEVGYDGSNLTDTQNIGETFVEKLYRECIDWLGELFEENE